MKLYLLFLSLIFVGEGKSENTSETKYAYTYYITIHFTTFIFSILIYNSFEILYTF